jgi:Uma2 family endonuclease
MTVIDRPSAGPNLDRLYTADELRAFPRDWHYELIHGRLRSLAMPTSRGHGLQTSRLSARIAVFVDDRGLGETFASETGFLVGRNPDTVKAPDFAFIAANRATSTDATKFVPIIPDLVVETRSPSDRGPAVATKIREWLDAGVRVVLDLDPQTRTLTVHRPEAQSLVLSAGDTLTLDDLLPGFALPLERLLA